MPVTGAVPDAAGLSRNPSNSLAVRIPVKVPMKVFQELQLVGNFKLSVESVLCVG